MGRFDEVTQKLKQSQQDITTSLISKGCEIGGGSVAKFSEVSAYIDSIKSGGGYYILVKTDSNSGYVGGTITATKGELSVTGNIENQQCKLEVPEVGVWNIKSSNTASSITSVEVVDTFEGSLTCTANATIKVTVTNQALRDVMTGSYTITGPNSNNIGSGNYSIQSSLTGALPYENSFSAKAFGLYTLNINTSRSGNAHSPVNITKQLTVAENIEYTFNIYVSWNSNGNTIWDSNNQEQPSIDGESTTPQTEEQSIIYAVNTTDMTESQIEEIFNHIDEMIKQNKTQSEIEDYIASKEQEYSNSI